MKYMVQKVRSDANTGRFAKCSKSIENGIPSLQCVVKVGNVFMDAEIFKDNAKEVILNINLLSSLGLFRYHVFLSCKKYPKSSRNP